jgi:hypothetical protein
VIKDKQRAGVSLDRELGPFNLTMSRSEHPGQWGLLRDQHTEDRKQVSWDDYVPSGTSYWP